MWCSSLNKSLGGTFLGLLAPACLCPLELEVPEGTIRTTSPELAEEIASLLARYDPRVRAYLGTEGDRRPIIEIGLWRPFGPDRSAYKTPTHIVVQDVDEALEVLLVHELIHWHCSDHWDTLPVALEDGLAYLLSAALTGLDGYVLKSPVEEAISPALSLGLAEFHALGDEAFQHEILAAGIWIVGVVGVETLESLALRAYDAGFERIPYPWLEEVVPPLSRTVVHFQKALNLPPTL